MFYKFLKITIGTAVRIFFRNIEVGGDENIPPDKPVIFVSNHPSAFMDPLVLGIVSKRELYFFARADIFSPGFVKWITRKAHMSPIYRSVDGMDSLEKNEDVFAHGYKLLSEKKVLLLFGEGVTDEEFVRRVKSMKKGSMRIALGAENKFDFKLGVNIICVGINYSDPRKFRSDLLVNFSKPIDLLKFKDLFLEHHNKAMLELNKEIYSRLKEQVIHLENPGHADFFEQMLILTRKGINNEYFDKGTPLQKRWEYTKRLEEGVNKKEKENPGELLEIKKKIENYSEMLKKVGIPEFRNFGKMPPSDLSAILFLFFTLPVFILGIFNNYLPVRLSYFLSRKISKRPVFWSGTDMAFSIITVPVYYSIIIFILFHYSTLHPFYALLFLILMPFSGIFAFNYLQRFNSLLKKIKFHRFLKKKENEADALFKMQNSLVGEIEKNFL